MDGKCPECGTEMVVTESSMTFGNRRGTGTLGFSGYCPNPDCPTNETDMAKAAGPDGSQ